MRNAETVVFDKTGTLTNGTFNVVAVHTERRTSTRDQLLSYRGARRSVLEPPHRAVGQASVLPATIDQQRIDDVAKSAAAMAWRPCIDEHVVLVGNDKLMNAERHGLTTTASLRAPSLHVSMDGRLRRPHRHRRRA